MGSGALIDIGLPLSLFLIMVTKLPSPLVTKVLDFF